MWRHKRRVGTLCVAISMVLSAAAARAGQPATPDELKAGKFIYERACISCHGRQGRGDGVAAPLLDPRPRDFTRGLFKFRSTPTGTMPTLDDLVRTERLGVAGTAMGQWEELSPTDRRAVLLYIQTFSRFGWQEGKPIMVPLEPPFSAESVTRGAQWYARLQCEKCHGATGRGDGPSAAELKDSWERPIRPTDLTLGYRYKRGSTPRDIYLTFFTGLMGTPMPSYSGTLQNAQQEWELVHYVYSLSLRRRMP